MVLGTSRVSDGGIKEARLYRGLLLFVGAIYLLWWLAVHVLLPQAFNPFTSRLVLSLLFWGVAAASYVSPFVRSQLHLGWTCALWLVTAHYYYLFYYNGGDLNWIVGSFIAVGAISLGMLSRAALVSYSIFASGLSIAMAVLIPSLRQSVFLPGIVTVLLQANIGLHSRLGVIGDLAASNEHFQLLFNSTFEGILVHEQGRIVQVNDVVLQMLGYARADLLGLSVIDIIHPESRAFVAENLKQQSSDAVQVKGLRKDGSSLDMETRGKTFVHDQRAYRLVTMQDVTERNRQASALRQSNEALERSNIDLQRFAYVASHDLQTPLRSIASFVDLLHTTYEPALDAQGKDWLARTSQSVHHLQTLIHDLLDYSLLEAQARPFKVISFRTVVDRAASLLDAAVKESHAQITADDLPEVKGDPSQLVQLMLNLLGNAIKYHGTAAPQIRVRAEDQGQEWIFSVEDNGIGIDAKHHQRIFEIFKRLHDLKEYPGTGIGLAVCRRVVQGHGGKIWVESEPGRGSTFRFTIAKEGAKDGARA